jgi:hypothetical protein
MLLEPKRPCRFNGPMDILAQAIADLATLVTFQQRHPPAPSEEPQDSEQTSLPDYNDDVRSITIT